VRADANTDAIAAIMSYPKGVLVSRRGGLWLSLQDDNGWAPGQSPQHRKLVVKSQEAER
jgi:hypothetical protein